MSNLYLREDVRAHEEQNIEKKENQNSSGYINSNVQDNKKYGPAAKKKQNSQQAKLQLNLRKFSIRKFKSTCTCNYP
jgi:hypothetical protein